MSKSNISSVRARVERDAAAKLDAQRRAESLPTETATSSIAVATYPSKSLVLENGRYHAADQEK